MGSLPPWMSDKAAKKKQNKRSRTQERKRADEVGGRPTAGSGSSWRSAGDVSTDDVLEEVKFTDKASYSLKVADLQAIRRKALNTGKEPSFLVEFSEHNMRVIIQIEDL